MVGFDVAADHAALFKVLLVVFLSLPEGCGRDDPGCDGFAERAGGVELGNFRIGLCGLIVRFAKDNGAVLGAPVWALAVELGGVVEGEEGVEEGLVGDTLGIKGKLNDLCVPGAIGTDFLVDVSVGWSRAPPSYPTAVSSPPLISVKRASTPQKQPAPNVAFCVAMLRYSFTITCVL